MDRQKLRNIYREMVLTPWQKELHGMPLTAKELVRKAEGKKIKLAQEALNNVKFDYTKRLPHPNCPCCGHHYNGEEYMRNCSELFPSYSPYHPATHKCQKCSETYALLFIVEAGCYVVSKLNIGNE